MTTTEFFFLVLGFDVPFFFAADVADRSFRRVQNADGLAGSYYNLLVVVLGISLVYPLKTQRGFDTPSVRFRKEGHNDIAKFLSSRCVNVIGSLISVQISVIHYQYFFYVFRSALLITSVLTFLRVKSSHNPYVPLNAVQLIVKLSSISINTGESPIINRSPSLRIPYCVSSKCVPHPT